MPLRPTTQWRCALQNGTSAPTEAVWVTDDTLSRAFQRFLNVSKAKRRAVSSVPGPMYHRSRLGRRRMTELNSFQHNGALPPWALPDAPDLTKWLWQPPKADLWAPAPKPPNPPLVSVEPPEALQAPLREVAQPIPIEMKSQPWHDFIEQLLDIHKIQYNTVEEYGARFKTFVRRYKKTLSKGKLTSSAAADIYTIASRHLETAHRNFHGLDFPKLRRLQLYLMTATCSGIRSAKELDTTFCITTPYFWEYMLRQVAKIEVSVETARVLTFTLNNLRPRSLSNASELVLTALNQVFKLWRGAQPHGEPEFWDQAEISATSGMASMWSGRVEQLLKEIRSDLAKNRLEAARFRLAAAERCVHRARRFTMKTAYLMSDDQQITDVIGEGLKDWKHERCGILFKKATLLLGKPRVHWTRSHYNWLQILVRMKRVQTKDLKKHLGFFAPRGHAALSHTELGHLLLLHWRTQGALQDMGWTARLWRHIGSDNNTMVLAALALAINRTNSPTACTAIFYDFWGILKLRGGRTTLIRQVSLLAKYQKLSSGFLKRLAWTSNDPRVALLLHDVLVKQTGKVQQYWWPQFWDKFATLLTTKYRKARIDPIRLAHGLMGRKAERQSLEWMEQNASEARLLQQPASNGLEQDYYKNLEAVDSQPMNHQLVTYSPQGHRELKQKWAQQVERVKKGLQLLARSPNLSDSQALRQVSIFTNTLARKQGYLSAHDLSTLSSVIIRLLDHGKMGPTDRLRHYLGLVYDHLGRDVCLKVSTIMKDRRSQNWPLWKDETQRKREENEEQLHIRRSYVLWTSFVGRNRRRTRRLTLRARQARQARQARLMPSSH